MKTYFVIKDTEKFKKGEIINLPREEARLYVAQRVILPFQIAARQGLVEKLKIEPKIEPEKTFKKKKKSKKLYKLI